MTTVGKTIPVLVLVSTLLQGCGGTALNIKAGGHGPIGQAFTDLGAKIHETYVVNCVNGTVVEYVAHRAEVRDGTFQAKLESGALCR